MEETTILEIKSSTLTDQIVINLGLHLNDSEYYLLYTIVLESFKNHNELLINELNTMKFVNYENEILKVVNQTVDACIAKIKLV